MRIRIIAIGHKMPAWVQHGCDEYSKRLPREMGLELTELPLAHRSKNQPLQRAVKAEGDAMLSAIPDTDRAIALDVKGSAWSTTKLAEKLRDWQLSGDNYSLLIGGPDGLSESCLTRAEQRWSLSPLTLPHPLVRVLLIEQLYRAWTINTGHPYHK